MPDYSLLLKALVAFALCTPPKAFAGVFIDFETLPNGSPAPDGNPVSGDPSPIGDAYAPWGVVFSSHAEGHPKFYDWYGSAGNFAITLASGGVGITSPSLFRRNSAGASDPVKGPMRVV